MAKSISELTQIIDDFANLRGWHDDDPNQLISSILIELGELAEHFVLQREFKKLSKEKRLEVGYEFVDIIFFLFRLASKSGIDIEYYFDKKLPGLEKKFPIGRDWNEAHSSYRKSGKNNRYGN